MMPLTAHAHELMTSTTLLLTEGASTAAQAVHHAALDPHRTTIGIADQTDGVTTLHMLHTTRRRSLQQLHRVAGIGSTAAVCRRLNMAIILDSHMLSREAA